MNMLLCNPRSWNNTETHFPTANPMPEKLRRDWNPNPNLELSQKTETGKPRTAKKLPSKTKWKTSSPPRRRPSEQHKRRYTSPLRSTGEGRNNPNLLKTLLIDTGMYTARRNRGSPQPPEPTRPPEARGNQRKRRRNRVRSRFALFYCR